MFIFVSANALNFYKSKILLYSKALSVNFSATE